MPGAGANAIGEFVGESAGGGAGGEAGGRFDPMVGPAEVGGSSACRRAGADQERAGATKGRIRVPKVGLAAGGSHGLSGPLFQSSDTGGSSDCGPWVQFSATLPKIATRTRTPSTTPIRISADPATGGFRNGSGVHVCMCGHDIDGTLNTGGGSALRCLSIDDFVAAPRLAWRQPVNLGRLSRVQVSSEPGNTATSSVPSSLMSAGRTHAMRVGVD